MILIIIIIMILFLHGSFVKSIEISLDSVSLSVRLPTQPCSYTVCSSVRNTDVCMYIQIQYRNMNI